MLTNNEDPDQMPHYVASDQGLHCLLLTLLQGFPGKNGLIRKSLEEIFFLVLSFFFAL